MYPRLRIDISTLDLARALGYCVWASGRLEPPLGSEAADEVLVTLSVRSAFDLLLAAIDLPAGSEVLFSELTVPHMPRIVREHGLTPVGVPLDPRTLSVSTTDVEARLTPQTKLLVVAHLFGSRMPLDELGCLCRQRGIVLVEDCAQALACGTVSRNPAADISLYSFGPIKTATALGGGIALVADESLRARMKGVAAKWPTQSTVSYAARLLKVAGLKTLSHPVLFTAMVKFIEALGGDADHFVGHSARGFPDEQLFAHLRQEPCVALKQLMSRRLSHFDKRTIAQREKRGQQLAPSIRAPAFVAGCDNPTHTYWVFPIVCELLEPAVRVLRKRGFDASQISGLTVVGDDSPGHWFRRTVFVPHGPQVPVAKIANLASALREATGAATRGTPLPNP
jgi:dTDP-4-amino-4,6-dideoxygalactose transaminase